MGWDHNFLNAKNNVVETHSNSKMNTKSIPREEGVLPTEMYSLSEHKQEGRCSPEATPTWLPRQRHYGNLPMSCTSPEQGPRECGGAPTDSASQHLPTGEGEAKWPPCWGSCWGFPAKATRQACWGRGGRTAWTGPLQHSAPPLPDPSRAKEDHLP